MARSKTVSRRRKAGRKSTTKRKAAKARRSPTRKTRTKRGRRYSEGAQRKVGKVMHEFKEGTLRSGGSGAKVKSRRQAIAIGISEARAAGKKVPKRRKTARKS